jgi:hypothetical protein
MLAGLDSIVVPAIFDIEVTSALVRRGSAIASVREYLERDLAAREIITIGPRAARAISGPRRIGGSDESGGDEQLDGSGHAWLKANELKANELKANELKANEGALTRQPRGGRGVRGGLELLASEWVRLIDPAMVSRETIRRRLAENELKPWPRKIGASGATSPRPPNEPVDSLSRTLFQDRRRGASHAWGEQPRVDPGCSARALRCASVSPRTARA